MNKSKPLKWLLCLMCTACMLFSLSAVRAEETPEPGNSSHVQEKSEEKEAEGKSPSETKNTEKSASLSERESEALSEDGQNPLRVVKTYDLWVSGVRVDEDNQSDILGDGTASYAENEESGEKILTLKNASLEVKDLAKEAGESVSAAIYTKDHLIVQVSGEASITQSEEQPDGNLVTGIRANAVQEKSLRIKGGTLKLSVSANAGKDAIGISINADRADAGQMLAFDSTNVTILVGSSDTAKAVKGIQCGETYFSDSTLEIRCEKAEEQTGISFTYANIDDSNITVTTGESDKAYGIYARIVSTLGMSGFHIIGASNIVLDASKSTAGIGAYEEAQSELLVFDQSTLEVCGSDKAIHYSTINDKEDRGALARKTLSDSETPVYFNEDLSALSDNYCYVAIPMDLRWYDLTSADSKWYKGSGKPARFTWKNADDDRRTFSHFANLMFDNTELDSSCYFCEEGSLKISLLPAFLETQAEGTHTVQAIFSDGKSDTAEFTIEPKKPSPTSDPSEESSSGSDASQKGFVITCQMAGYPQGYEWNEEAKACQMGTVDAQGKFHSASAANTAVKYAAVNTGDKGLKGPLITFITALAAALWSGSKLWKYR